MKKADAPVKSGIVDKVVYSVGKAVISGIVFYLACLILYAVLYRSLMPSAFLTMYGVFCLIGAVLVLVRFHFAGYIFMLGAFLGLAADCYLSDDVVSEFGIINAFILGAFTVLAVFVVLRRFKKKAPQSPSATASAQKPDVSPDAGPVSDNKDISGNN